MLTRRKFIGAGAGAFGALTSGCDEAPAQSLTVPKLEPKLPVVAPPEYLGPIDESWPPSHPARLELHLEASRLVRERLERGQAPYPADISVPRDLERVHVEAGKLGGISYLEAIVGRPAHPDDPMPLVLLLHGRGGKASIPSNIDTSVPARLFIPQAPDALGTGFTWLAARTLDGQDQLLTRSLSARADQLQPVIEAFIKLRPTLGRPSIAGFSQGAILTYALATRFPKQYAAAFPIAGWLPPALYPTPRAGERFPYIFAQHGGGDQVVPTARDRETVRALRARGLRVDYREEPGVPHVVTPAMNREVQIALQRIFEVFRASVRSRPAPRTGRFSALTE